MTISENERIRMFSCGVDNEELIWHRDKRDRIVEVIECKDWFFQFENELPIALKPGDTLSISKMVFHRLIKGDGALVIKILER